MSKPSGSALSLFLVASSLFVLLGAGAIQAQSVPVNDLMKRAEGNDVQAQLALGLAYINGKDVKKDFKKANEWFEKAAKTGNADAQFNLGVMYALGEGVASDFKKAAEWYLKAAEQGQPDAQFSLGTMYQTGEGVKQDYKEAAKWLRQAAATWRSILMRKSEADGAKNARQPVKP